MKWATIFLVVLSMLGCGSSGGSSRAVSTPGSGTGSGGVQQPLLYEQLRISENQTSGSGLVVASRLQVRNVDAVDHEFFTITGRFESNIPNFVMNYEVFFNGKPIERKVFIQGGQRVTMQVNKVLTPNSSNFITIHANPHNLMLGDNIRFVIENFEVDRQVVTPPSQPIEITVNPAGVFDSLFDDIPVFIPYPTNTTNMVAYVEELLPRNTIEQVLYDYDVRFRSGQVGQHPNLNIKGQMELQVSDDLVTPSWRVVDSVPIHGHHVSVTYKLFFFEEALGNGKRVRVVLSVNGCNTGDVVRVSRTAIGSDTGYRIYPTRHGPDLRCP